MFKPGLVPEDRLKLLNSSGDVVKEHLGLPEEIKVHDMWERHAVVYDILEIVIGYQMQTRFVVKIDQTWTHEQPLTHLAKIPTKNVSQLDIVDMSGTPWHYPEDRQLTSTLVVRVRPFPVK